MPKIIISNTTPIISLIGVGQLPLLKLFYEKVIIPQAVYDEIESGQNKKAYQPLAELDWIEVKAVKNAASVLYLQDTLDKGEAEVIVLAGELNADLVLLDEKAARQVAAFHKVKFTGTLGILLKAKKEGVIPAIAPILDQMADNGIWMSVFLRDSLLKEAKEE